MKLIHIAIFLLASFPLLLCSQVPDSSFGVPASFAGPDYPFPAVTACDFDGREDRSFATLFLESGNIMLAGHTQGADGTDFALVRLLHDGKFDASAGPEGQMRLDLGYTNDSCLAAVLYGNDRIVMGGCVTLPGQEGYVNLVARVDTNGQFDGAFGQNGHVTIDLPTEYEMITEIIVLPNGHILIAGNAFFGTSFQFPDATTVFVARLLPDGRIDTTFGTNGIVYQRYEHDCRSSLLGDVVVDADDRIILSGGSYTPYPGVYGGATYCSHNINVCCYLPNGQPDPSFGKNGKLELPYTGGRAVALHIDELSRIMVAGVINAGVPVEPGYTLFYRLLPDGTPDTTFANNGRFVKYILGISGSSEPVGIIKAKDHYYCGFVDVAQGDHLWFGLMRLHEYGKIDSLFGKKGLFKSYGWLPGTSYQINQVHSVNDQAFYLSGYYSKLSQDNMMIVKIRTDETVSSKELVLINNDQRIRIFPNPVKGDKVQISYERDVEKEPLLIQLTDMQGRLMYRQWMSFDDATQELALPDMPNGVYMMSCKGRHRCTIGKLVIQR
ncbi:MAG: T9SS type A sorting domain-containing protein [Saprospiraceae bacterium]